MTPKSKRTTAPPQKNPGILLTVNQVAERLNVTVRMVYRLTQDGRLPSHKIGTHLRVHSDDLDDFIAGCRQPYAC